MTGSGSVAPGTPAAVAIGAGVAAPEEVEVLLAATAEVTAASPAQVRLAARAAVVRVAARGAVAAAGLLIGGLAAVGAAAGGLAEVGLVSRAALGSGALAAAVGFGFGVESAEESIYAQLRALEAV